MISSPPTTIVPPPHPTPPFPAPDVTVVIDVLVTCVPQTVPVRVPLVSVGDAGTIVTCVTPQILLSLVRVLLTRISYIRAVVLEKLFTVIQRDTVIT